MRNRLFVGILILMASVFVANAHPKIDSCMSEDDALNCLLSLTFNDSADLVSWNANVSSLYLNQGETDKALEFGFQALEFAEGLEPSNQMKAALVIGQAYRRLQDFEQSADFFRMAQRNALNDSTRLPRIYNSLGILYNQLGDFNTSKSSLDSGYTIAESIGDSMGMAKIITNLGFLHNRANKYPEAIRYYEESIALKEKLNNPTSLAYSLNDLGEIYSYIGEFDKAIALSKKALILAEEAQHIYYMRDMNRTLANTYAERGSFDSAFYHQEIFQAIQDSISNQDVARQVAALEKEKELREKDKLNSTLAAKNELQSIEIDQRNRLLLFLSIIAIMLAMLGFTLYRSAQLKKQLLAELEHRNRLLDRQNIELQTSMNEQESLFQIVKNDIKRPLKNAVDLLDLQNSETNPDTIAARRGKVTASAKNALDFIDDFDTIIRYEKTTEDPPILEFDLVKLVNTISDDFRSSIKKKNMNLHFIAPPELAVKSNEQYVKHIVYNVFQNAVQYSPEGSHLFVSIITGDIPRISIEDQGPGIDPNNHERIFERFYRGKSQDGSDVHSSGLGLSVAKLLSDRIGGRIKLRSEVGKGSEFVIYLG